ncbi:MAG: NADP-dependent oxidoreductase, partial [Nocardioides sp.]
RRRPGGHARRRGGPGGGVRAQGPRAKRHVAELVAAHIRAVPKVPDDVDLVDAGALPLAGLTAAQLLDATEVAAGDTVLVHAAAGGVGSFATQLAVARGARVLGTGSTSGHDYLRGLGAEPLEYGEGLTARVEELCPGGVDVVVDLIGGDALAATPDLLAPNGRVGSIVEADTVHELGGRYVFVRPDAGMLGELLQQVGRGEVKVHIAERFGLDQAAEALAASKTGHVRGKVVLTL